MGMVFPVSTHNYEIRYWLAAAGINPGMYTAENVQGQIDAEVLLSVTPPPQMPATLESSNQSNYISLNFPNGLLYCCLSETYGYLKGPADMLTLYEQKYKEEVQKFASQQIGRRRRDDYTDGTVRIPIESPPQ